MNDNDDIIVENDLPKDFKTLDPIDAFFAKKDQEAGLTSSLVTDNVTVPTSGLIDLDEARKPRQNQTDIRLLNPADIATQTVKGVADTIEKAAKDKPLDNFLTTKQSIEADSNLSDEQKALYLSKAQQKFLQDRIESVAKLPKAMTETVKGLFAGMAQGATREFADELVAGLSAAALQQMDASENFKQFDPTTKQVVTKPLAFNEIYKTIRDQTRRDLAKIESEAPVANFIGNMVGGTAARLPKLGKWADKDTGSFIANSLKRGVEGGVEGALFGAGSAENIEDVPDAAKSSAMIGAGAGGVLSAADAIVRDIARSKSGALLGDVYEAGRKGVDLIGEKEKLAIDLKEAVETTLAKLEKAQESAGAAGRAILEELEQQGSTANIKSFLKVKRKKLESQILDNTYEKEVRTDFARILSFINELEDGITKHGPEFTQILKYPKEQLAENITKAKTALQGKIDVENLKAEKNIPGLQAEKKLEKTFAKKEVVPLSTGADLESSLLPSQVVEVSPENLTGLVKAGPDGEFLSEVYRTAKPGVIETVTTPNGNTIAYFVDEASGKFVYKNVPAGEFVTKKISPVEQVKALNPESTTITQLKSLQEQIRQMSKVGERPLQTTAGQKEAANIAKVFKGYATEGVEEGTKKRVLQEVTKMPEYIAKKATPGITQKELDSFATELANKRAAQVQARIDTHDATFGSVKEARSIFGVDESSLSRNASRNDIIKENVQSIEKLAKIVSQLQPGEDSYIKFVSALENIKKVNPELAQEIESLLVNARKNADLYNFLSDRFFGGESNFDKVLSMASSVAVPVTRMGAYEAGKFVRAVSDSDLAKLLFKATPERLEQLMNKIPVGSTLYKQLKEAVSKPDNIRRALLFSIIDNVGSRNYLRKYWNAEAPLQEQSPDDIIPEPSEQ